MQSKGEAVKTLKKLVQDVGIPNCLTYNGAKEQVRPNSQFQKIVRKHQIKDHQNEAETQKYNQAEDSIRELKWRWKSRMVRRRIPKWVWDFALVWEGEILSRMCHHGKDFTEIERVSGDTVDISE